MWKSVEVKCDKISTKFGQKGKVNCNLGETIPLKKLKTDEINRTSNLLVRCPFSKEPVLMEILWKCEAANPPIKLIYYHSVHRNKTKPNISR